MRYWPVENLWISYPQGYPQLWKNLWKTLGYRRVTCPPGGWFKFQLSRQAHALHAITIFVGFFWGVMRDYDFFGDFHGALRAIKTVQGFFTELSQHVRSFLKRVDFLTLMPHTRTMNKTIAYSTITDLALPFDLCCDERMMLCPDCGTELCMFCMDGCDVCDSEIDYSK